MQRKLHRSVTEMRRSRMGRLKASRGCAGFIPEGSTVRGYRRPVASPDSGSRAIGRNPLTRLSGSSGLRLTAVGGVGGLDGGSQEIGGGGDALKLRRHHKELIGRALGQSRQILNVQVFEHVGRGRGVME